MCKERMNNLHATTTNLILMYILYSNIYIPPSRGEYYVMLLKYSIR